MPIPSIQPIQINPAKPVSNYLAGQKFAEDRYESQQNELRAQAQEGRAVRQENRLAIRFGQEQEDRATELQYKKLGKEYNALSMALRGSTAEQQQQILKSLWPDQENPPEIKMVGPNHSIAFPDGTTIKGPSALLADMFGAIGKNPEWMGDKNFQKNLIAYIRSHPGISVEQQKTETKITYGSPYQREDGTWVQKSSSGKITKVPSTDIPKTKDLDWYNKRIEDLQAAKLKAQTTKGLDAIDLFLLGDSEKAKEAYERSDSAALITEIDKQIKEYEGKRASLETPKKAQPLVDDLDLTSPTIPDTIKTTTEAYKHLTNYYKMSDAEARKFIIDLLKNTKGITQ